MGLGKRCPFGRCCRHPAGSQGIRGPAAGCAAITDYERAYEHQPRTWYDAEGDGHLSTWDLDEH